MKRGWFGKLVQALVSLMVLAVWGYVQWSILKTPIPEGSRDIVMRAMGILDASTIMVLTFWLGTSLSSARKDEAKGEASDRG